MPRDSNGVYTLPPSNPVVTGTPIASGGWANPTMADLGNEVTNSLDRSGRGGMTGPFGVTDGTLSAPGLRFTSDPDNGFRRTGANTWTLVAGGVDICTVSPIGFTLSTGLIAVGFGEPTNISDTTPTGFSTGEQWWESDTGALYLSYQNPDLTQTIVGISAQGGNYIPVAEKAAANGVASLDGTGKVPSAQLPAVSSSPGADSLQVFLLSDFTLNNTSTYFDIINTGAIGAAGQKWLITVYATLLEPTLNGQNLVRIWDGTTVYAEVPAIIQNVSSGSGFIVSIQAVVTLTGPTTFRLSCKDTTNTNGLVKTTGASGTANKATSIAAVRLS